jgi:2-methylcitrate dehydratase PrpD
MTEMQSLPQPSAAFDRVAGFIRGLEYKAVPAEVTHTAALLMLDLIGVLAGASKLDAGRIARDHAARHWAAGGGAPTARLPFDGRRASLPGMSFAMATQIDNLDAHDGWQPSKGHAGAAIFPALCAFAEAETAVSGREALLAMVLGYEVSYRAAAALHATVADYHTSGAWNGLGCVAVGARLRRTSNEHLRQALGIAEYHAPRSQMMREIANPSMLHDGTGWGAPTGLYALLIAEDGFRGAPAATVEFDDADFAWADLGHNWLTAQQYIKPYPICRWAHAPIDAALKLRREHGLSAKMIEDVEIATFAWSAELNGGVPSSSPVAQYSLAWPVAAALARGHVGVDEVLEKSFADPELIALTSRTRAIVDPEFEAGYPARRLASVAITLKDGRIVRSGATEASGGPDPQPTEAEVVAKFRRFAEPILGNARAARIEAAVLGLGAAGADFKPVLDLIEEPPGG